MSDVEVNAASAEQECVEKCEQLSLEESANEGAKKCECGEKCECADKIESSKIDEPAEPTEAGDNEVGAEEAVEKGAEECAAESKEECAKDCCSAEAENATESTE